jgi:hypothetical protein
VLFEEGPDLIPAIDCLLLPVGRPVIVEEAVAGAVIAVEFVILAVFLQLLLMLIHLGRGGGLVVIAEEPQQRARQVLREVNGRRGLLGGQLFLGLYHSAPPALDSGVKAGGATGHEEGLAAA